MRRRIRTSVTFMLVLQTTRVHVPGAEDAGHHFGRWYGARTSGQSPWGGRHRASPIHRRRARAASFITGHHFHAIDATPTSRVGLRRATRGNRLSHTTTASRGRPPRGRLRRGAPHGPLTQRPAVRRRAISWPNLKVGVEDRPLPRINFKWLRRNRRVDKIQTQPVHEAPPMARRTPRSRPARVAAALRR